MINRREFLVTSCLLPALGGAEAQSGNHPVAQPLEMLLSGSDWKLGSFAMDEGESRKAFLPVFDDSAFNVVRVPGEVQVQLGLQGMDLYSQSKELTLINEREWWYRKRFVVPADARGKLVRLVFDGVDYFATAWLNGKKLGEHEGCFVGFSFDISSQLNYGGENALAVKVTCPWLPPGRAFQEYIKGELTMSTLGGRVRFSFPPFVLGPSWGTPGGGNAVFPMGLWRDVRLLLSDRVVIDDLFVATKSLNADESATLQVSGTITNHLKQGMSGTLALAIAPENFSGETLTLPTQDIRVHPGSNRFTVETVVKRPQLWWTWDLGTPHLYRVTAELGSGGGKATRESVFGIRTISRDENLRYRLNGEQLFLKGTWYWQAEWLGSLATRETYTRDLEMYKACNLNHVVAFCYVEKPDFYDLCDRLGILTFFEFPFNQFGPVEVLSKSYPRRDEYVRNALGQVRDIIMQLRNHPSIGVWAALAEAQMEHKGWGVGNEDFNQYGYEEFSEAIAKLIKELSPGTIYHPSLCDFGEQHFWMAGTGMAFANGDYTEHFNAASKFVSEYGSQALPDYESLRRMLRPDELWATDAGRLPRWSLPIDVTAYAYICEYEYNGLATNLKYAQQYVDGHIGSAKELAEASELYQAFLIQYATEAYRRKKYRPINGTRIWCYGDPYPCISWSLVDYYRVPKMAYYFLKKAQERLALSFAYEEALESQVAGKRLRIPVWVINDHRREMPVDVECELLDLAGRRVREKRLSGTVGSDDAKEIGILEWLAPDEPGTYVLRGRAAERGGTASVTTCTFIKVTPRLFTRKVKMLLIGQRAFSQPIAGMARAAGLDVIVIEENNFRELARLQSAEDVRSNYDLVWLAHFESIWKLLDENKIKGLKEAIRQGVGFIHTGGAGSYHGGADYAACLEFTGLAEVLPVAILNRNDVVLGQPSRNSSNAFGPAGNIGNFENFMPVQDIQAVQPGWNGQKLNKYGLPGFNEVRLKTGGEQTLTVAGRPLSVTGRYGQGRTVAFTGFTPAWKAERPIENSNTLHPYLPDQELSAHPGTEAYFDLFMRMIAEVTGEKPAVEYDTLLSSRAVPLFETLKQLPTATVKLPEVLQAPVAGRRTRLSFTVTNGPRYARLVRIRAEWKQPSQPTPYLVTYSDNYFDLFPEEDKKLALEVFLPNEEGTHPVEGTIVVEGSNLARLEIPVRLEAISKPCTKG